MIATILVHQVGNLVAVGLEGQVAARDWYLPISLRYFTDLADETHFWSGREKTPPISTRSCM